MNEWAQANEKQKEKNVNSALRPATHRAAAAGPGRLGTGICNSGSSEKKWIQLIFPPYCGVARELDCYRSEEITRKLFVSSTASQIERSGTTCIINVHTCERDFYQMNAMKNAQSVYTKSSLMAIKSVY